MSITTTVIMRITPDDKGYFDKQCPKCRKCFKIKEDDYFDKFLDNKIFCVYCREMDDINRFITEGQKREFKKKCNAKLAIGLQNSLFGRFVDKKIRHEDGSFTEIEFDKEKNLSIINSPIGPLEEMERDLTCFSCGTRYNARGEVFFCPNCGELRPPKEIFDDSINVLIMTIDSFEQIKLNDEQLLGKDYAETRSISLIEGSLGKVVSAFQRFAKETFTSRSNKQVRPNDFQIVQKGSNLYKEEFGSGYDKWLNLNELEFMELMFQRRHILEHNSGIVDEKYLEKSKDSTYKTNQRVVVKPSEVKQLIDIIIRLSDGLKTIVEREV